MSNIVDWKSLADSIRLPTGADPELAPYIEHIRSQVLPYTGEYQADWLHNRLSELIGVKLDKDSRIVASALANFGSYRFNDLLNAMVQHQQDMIDSGDWDEDDC